MRINITKEAAEKHGLSLGEAFLLLLITNKKVLMEEKAEGNLILKGLITKDFEDGGWRATRDGISRIDSIALDSDKDIKPENSLEDLAMKLKELFPKGKKDGTNRYWAEGKALIIRRLQLFFKKYGEYNHDLIIDATKKYIESFNGDYTYMKTLRYFILKESIGASGDIEGTSDLLNYIENLDQDEDMRNEWNTELI